MPARSSRPFQDLVAVARWALLGVGAVLPTSEGPPGDVIEAYLEREASAIR